MFHLRNLLPLSALLLGFAHVWAQAAPLPLQTCTPAQVRATERFWFTGNRIAMDFGVSGTNVPTITANNASVSNIAEGSTVVTDANGTLQFWSGQGSIYNRNQAIMSNGASLTSNTSAVQAAAAFAAPTIPGKYFVVTTTGLASNTPGLLYYAVVDMTLNGGLGAVTTKNVPIPGISSNETLTAVPNHDGTGYWVLTSSYQTNNIVAQLFDSNGPSGSPVITPLSTPIGSRFGSIYFNKDLTQFAMVNGTSSTTNNAALLTLNAQTGVVTEVAAWKSGAQGTAYAADFSPSGKYLYVSHIYDGRLYRYDVSSNNAATIKASEEYIGATGGNVNGGGHVRRGADGAMWIANQSNSPSATLSRIAQPDAPVATIAFSHGNVPLAANTNSAWGLPQTVAGCAKALAPDAIPTATTPAAPFTINTPQSVAINVNNGGALGDVTDGKLLITLPSNVQLNGALPAACTAVSAQQVECDLALLGPIKPGSTVGPLNIPVTVSAPGTYIVDVQVQGITGEVGASLDNNATQASLTAVTPPAAPDAIPTATAPTAPFPVNTSQNMVVSVENGGTTGSITDGKLIVDLPPNVQAGNNLPQGCTVITPQQVECNLATLGPIAPGGTVGPLNIPITVSTPGTYTANVRVEGVTGEAGTALNNNTTQTSFTSQATTPPITGGGSATPVPTLGFGALAALSAALGGLAVAGRRRQCTPVTRKE